MVVKMATQHIDRSNVHFDAKFSIDSWVMLTALP